MAFAQRTDPLRNFKFKVQIVPVGGLAKHAPNLPNLGFAEMSGLSVTNEMIPYREGGMNTHPHKMVGQSDFPPVSFSRGVFAQDGEKDSGDKGLWNWQTFIHAWQSGVATGSTGTNTAADDNNYRCDIIVKVYDHPYTKTGTSYLDSDIALNTDINPSGQNEARLAFKLFNAWPGVFAMNGLNATDNGIMIQQMTIHHEGFYVAFNDADIKAIGTTR